jgi:hypothetical protein
LHRQFLPDSAGRALCVFSALTAGLLASACESSSPGPTDPPTPAGCVDANLAPGQHLVFDGSAAVDCVILPAAAPGVEYEVVATSMARALAFQEMELRLGPVDASSIVQTATASSLEALGPSEVPARRLPAAFLASADDDARLAAWRNAQSAFDLRLRQLEAPLLPQIRQRAAVPTGALFEVPAVGDTLDFGFSCINQTDFPNAPDDVRGVVRNVSSRAVVVEDILADGAFSAAEYAEIAANFDDPVYDTDVTYFGEPGDIDANGRIILLYSAGVNRMSENYDEGFIAGFTCPLDLGFVGGNDAEMFYLMVPDPDGDLTPDPGDGIEKDAVLRFTDNTVAHEFQHMINAQTGNGGAQDIWINEGLSHLAEEVVGHALNGVGPGEELGPEDLLSTSDQQNIFRKWYLNNWFNLAQYLNSPADTAALLVATDPLDFNTFRMRGSAWMFLRYALDRSQETTAGEAALTRALIQTSFSNSRDAVSDVFGIDFDRLATDWGGMLTAEDRADVAAGPDLLLSSYQLREIYESSVGALITPPNGGYPLEPVVRSLGSAAVLDAELFTATGLYLTLRATQNADPTQIELVDGSGDELADSIEPRLVILRTN